MTDPLTEERPVADPQTLADLLAEAFSIVDLAAEASAGCCPKELLRFSGDVACYLAEEVTDDQRLELAHYLRKHCGFQALDQSPLPSAAELLDDLFFVRLRALGWLEPR